MGDGDGVAFQWLHIVDRGDIRRQPEICVLVMARKERDPRGVQKASVGKLQIGCTVVRAIVVEAICALLWQPEQEEIYRRLNGRNLFTGGY